MSLLELITDNDIAISEERLVNYHRSLTDYPKKIRRNKWRPDVGLEPNNLEFTAILGVGGHGSVFLVIDRVKKKRYAVKIQNENLIARSSRQKRGQRPTTPKSDDDPLSHTPPLTPSSEASVISASEINVRNLIAKRFRENRCYLQYIKSGHPNICALEAFLDFKSLVGDEKDIVMFASFYEYCDGGDLGYYLARYKEGYDMIKKAMVANERITLQNLGRKLRGQEPNPLHPIRTRIHPPELFIWHIFSQLVSAIAFLHNDHPDYMKMDQHKNRGMIITADIAPANVFLKWPVTKYEERRKTYPDVKIGDFGTANFLPKGGHLKMGGEKTDHVWANPPEEDIYDGKTDVWSVGVMIYQLATQGKEVTWTEPDPWLKNHPRRPHGYETEADTAARHAREKIAQERVGDLEFMYSEQLNSACKYALQIDREKRLGAGQMLRALEDNYNVRKPFMFRELPMWAKNRVGCIKYNFPENRVRDLLAGKWEEERRKWEEEAAEAEEEDEREAKLMWVVKDRKLRFGIELEEEEEGDDEDHAQWLKELIRDEPELYEELLEEAREEVPSPPPSPDPS